MNSKLLLEYHINKILDKVGLVGHPYIDINDILTIVRTDLEAYIKKDPAAKNNEYLVINSYLGFRAVLGYRVANYITNSFRENFYFMKAREISENIKVQTGIEIHPSAKIGKSFVIDHGIGTVIGETSIIGNNCYILQGVIIGAKGISSNPSGKRHPTIGDNVEIGAFSKILGNIKIGNNVFIAPYSLITKDIPDNTKIISYNKKLI
jgi:serine O-acetyltransferase